MNLADKDFEGSYEKDDTIKIIDGYIVINKGFDYNIPIAGCATYKQILGWSLQVGEKTWADKELVLRFITVALREAKLDYPGVGG